jgi:transcriptional regulator with XRE-family HTH domain
VHRNLRNIRKQKGLTLKELARRAGVGVSTLGNFETMKYEISQEMIENLAKTLEVKPQDISRTVSETMYPEATSPGKISIVTEPPPHPFYDPDDTRFLLSLLKSMESAVLNRNEAGLEDLADVFARQIKQRKEIRDQKTTYPETTED